ncbi:MAG: MerR family transcriptional regulator [Pseudomonadota bacterium]|jgi:DNA-binding transcriptional MerR regulator
MTVGPSSPELVKLYYRIGEVARIVGVQPHVLRYWETEFRTIRPQKSSKGQRIYSRRDVEKLLRVKDLLKHQGFTIAGAKRRLRDQPTAAVSALAFMGSEPQSGDVEQASDLLAEADAVVAGRPRSEAPTAQLVTAHSPSAPPSSALRAHVPPAEIRPAAVSIVPRPISHRTAASDGSAKALRKALLSLRQDLLDLEHDLEADLLPRSGKATDAGSAAGGLPGTSAEPATSVFEVARKPREDGRPDASRGSSDR